MNHLTSTRSTSVAPTTIPSFVEADGPLGAAIRAVRRDVNIRPVSTDLQQSAWKHLHAIEPLCAPSIEAQMLAWLVKLAPGVVNAPTDAREIKARAEAIWDVCSALPCAVWCDETRRGWLRIQPAGKFWPAAGELFAHLETFARSLYADKAGCEFIIASTAERPSADEFEPPNEVQRQAVRTLMHAWREERADAQAASEAADEAKRPISTPLHLSDEHLLAVYERGERDGHEVSAYRAQILREKLDRTHEWDVGNG